MKTVKELAALCGISVRTLHYYDETGLLKPAATTQAGYRLYGEQEVARLQQILFFRELEFPLKEIKKILENPSFDEREAMARQRELLILKQKRLDRLIRLIDNTMKGSKAMLNAFDKKEIDAAAKRFSAEAKERWGDTAAWEEYQNKASRAEKEWIQNSNEADRIFKAFARHLRCEPDAPVLQSLVKQWQAYITENCYTCTDEILSQLGELYVTDERFLNFYEKHYGKGVAELLNAAIQFYCKRKVFE